MHSSSMVLMEQFRDKYLGGMRGCTVLDIGSCQQKNQENYRKLFGDYLYTGMDIVSGPNVDLVGYESIEGTYDVVISGQTLEHVTHPWDVMKKWATLFRKYICVIAPNTSKWHKCPIHTYQYYPDGFADLFEYAGIIPLEFRKEGHDTIGIGKHP